MVQKELEEAKIKARKEIQEELKQEMNAKIDSMFKQ